MKTQVEKMGIDTQYPFAIAIAHWLYARLKKLKHTYPFLDLMPMHVESNECSTQIKIINKDTPTRSLNYIDIVETHTKEESSFTIRFYEWREETKEYLDIEPIRGNYDCDMTDTVNIVWDHLFPSEYLENKRVA